jgi:hypothetical protein
MPEGRRRFRIRLSTSQLGHREPPRSSWAPDSSTIWSPDIATRWTAPQSREEPRALVANDPGLQKTRVGEAASPCEVRCRPPPAPEAHPSFFDAPRPVILTSPGTASGTNPPLHHLRRNSTAPAPTARRGSDLPQVVADGRATPPGAGRHHTRLTQRPPGARPARPKAHVLTSPTVSSPPNRPSAKPILKPPVDAHALTPDV